MRTLNAVALILAFAGAFASPSTAEAVPPGASRAAVIGESPAIDVALGCGPGHTRGDFGACVVLHHRHHRTHGRHHGHDYDIHDHKHYRDDPHLYHGRHHHHGHRHTKGARKPHRR